MGSVLPDPLFVCQVSAHSNCAFRNIVVCIPSRRYSAKSTITSKCPNASPWVPQNEIPDAPIAPGCVPRIETGGSNHCSPAPSSSALVLAMSYPSFIPRPSAHRRQFKYCFLTPFSSSLIWCAGLSCLSRSSNHTHETDRRNQMDQIPATRRDMLDCKT